MIEDWHQGDIVCTSCGTVCQERLIDDIHEEKRTFTADRATAGKKEDNSRTARVGPNDSISTRISMDSNPNSKNADTSTIAGITNSLITYKEQKLKEGENELMTICECLHLQQKVKVSI